MHGLFWAVPGSGAARARRHAGLLRALIAACALSAGWPADAATVRSFTPQGEVPVVRQARAVFSAPMVALGDADAAGPFAIDCAVPGSGQWADPTNWVYRFERALPAGTRCSFALRAGLRTLAGDAVTGPMRFAFDTGGPAILRSVPFDGSRIHEDQAFVLALTGAVDAATLRERVWCQAEGIGERIPVRLVDGRERDELFRRFSVRADQGLVVACTRRLPNGVAATLSWDAGIATPSGIALRRRQVLRFEVRPTFQASMSCQRENANAPCTPLAPIRIEFTSPIERALAQAIRLKFAGDAREREPDRERDGPVLTEGVTFRAPFPENAAFTLTLPAGLRDGDGRELANASTFPLASRTAGYPPLAKFASAPFGIVESMLEPVAVPVTLRYVERELTLRGLAPERPALRELRLQGDAQIIEWSARLRQFHERTLGEDELRLALGETPRRRAANEPEPEIESRTVSLLARESGATRIAMPEPAGAPAARDAAGWPFEVVGVPLAAPGYYVLELESARLGEALLGRRASMYVRSSALVTNLAVHFKRSGEQSIAWVTTLDAGRPVAGARVQVSDCRGKALWQGTTDADGLARIAQPLPEHSQPCDWNRPGYFVSARATDAKGRPDLSFVWSDWNEGIEPWRFGLPTAEPGETTARAHTVFDRTLLRAGETVSMKHLLRVARAEGLARPDDASLPPRALVVHTGSDQTWTFELRWKGAAAETVFPIPRSAKLGRYQVFLDYGASADAGDASAASAAPDAARAKRLWDGRRETGSFRVEAFRLPVYEGRLTPPSDPLVAPAQVVLQAQTSFVGGGPAAGLPMQVSAMLRPHLPSFDNYDDFRFGREDLASGDDDADPQTQRASSSGTGASGASDRGGVHRNRLVADKHALTLDAGGAGQVAISGLPPLAVPHRMRVEATFADPNGEIQSIAQTMTLWPSAQAVGIRTQGWVDAGRRLDASVAVVDTAGRPLAGAKVAVQAVLRRTLTHRKRLVGGFYAYENVTQERVLGEACAGATDARSLLACRFEPKLAAGDTGNLLLIARSADAQGRVASASTSVWLGGRGEHWFAADNHDRIDLLPERRRYAPGETAKFQLRMPFRYATAWVAIEREGIVETRVMQLSGREPTIELKVQPHWGPNVYVSVLAVRGRLHEVPWYSLLVWGWRAPLEWWRERQEYATLSVPTATVDLAKPTFRMGAAAIEVDANAQRLAVDVHSDRTDHPVRGTAKLRVRVRGPDGQPPPAGTEVALAAVDAALLELAPNDSWKLFEAMMQRRVWGVQTATAQMQVVGRRHFGRKAVPAGGGGGAGATRELFDTLLAWHPRLALDANGEASVEVKLNDSLTRFRIVAIADGGPGAFGTGETTIRATQDLQLISGLPLTVREGDAFNAMLTLRNTSAQPMTVTLKALAQAMVAGGPDEAAGAAPAGHADRGSATRSIELPALTQQIDVPAGAARSVALPVRVPERATELRWALEASDAARGASDRVALRQPVTPAVPPVVRQATLAPVAGTLSVPVSAPADALPGRSQVRVTLSSSIAGSLVGVRDWFARYPYGCLEQRVSRAVGLGDADGWQALMTELPAYVDADGLAQYFPMRAGEPPSGSEVLTAHLLALAHQAGLTIPGPQRDAMLEGLARWVEGRVRRSAWSPRADDSARRLAAIEALSRHGRANAAMVSALSFDPARLPTSALLDWIAVLGRVEGIERRDERLAKAQALLRARLSYAGTRMTFVQEEQDRWWWMMASPDGNAARLLLWAVSQPDWQDDAPRLATGLLGRQRGGAWDTTAANAWGTLAVRAFAASAEATPVDGSTVIALVHGGRSREARQRWAPSSAPTAPTAPTAPATPGAQPAPGSQPPAGEASFAFALAAGDATLRIAHEGAGRPWATVQAIAAVPLAQPRFAGYRLAREVQAVQRRAPDAWSRGDILRVRITIDAAQPMTWVVVSDPLPAGASVLGSGLRRDSAIALAQPQAPARAADPGAPQRRAATFEERAPDAMRAYYEHLPAGRYEYAYTLRLNQDGEFGLPPTRVEAMYAPEISGEVPNARMKVQP